MLVGSLSDRSQKSGYSISVRDLGSGIVADKIARSGDTHTRLRWRCTGIHITGCQDAKYPYDLDIVRQIRRINPALVPVFRRKFYQSPTGATYEFPHHGLACYDPDTAEPIASFTSMAMPSNCDWPRPTAMIRWFEAEYKPGSMAERYRLPRPYVPYGPWVVQWVAEADRLNSQSAAEKMRFIEEHGEATQARKAREFEEAEAAYRGKSEIPYMKRQMDNFGEDDWKEMKARMRGQIPREEKPFVDMSCGGTNPVETGGDGTNSIVTP